MQRRPRAGLLFAAGGSVAAAALGGLGSRRAPEVCAGRGKPSWAPPAGVFGPVWTGLYSGIAVSGWRLWQRRAERAARAALGLHAAQLALNAAWPWTFFSVRSRSAS